MLTIAIYSFQPHCNKAFIEKMLCFIPSKIPRFRQIFALLGCLSAAWVSGCQSAMISASATDDAAKDAMVAAIVRLDIVLFGEVHDNPAQHALRAEIVGKALDQGARPALAFEQFDRNVQARIDAALASKPSSADAFLDTLFPGNTRPKGWQWRLYAPLIEFALKYDLPIVAANLSRADATKVSMGGVDAVFDGPTQKMLGLDRTIAPNVSDEQRRAIKDGHCNALPDDGVTAMASAQLARDAVLAESLRVNTSRGVILFAGNGHTRRDVGVGYWLGNELKITSIGLLERADAAINTTPPFDIVLTTEPHPREDPCIAFRARREGSVVAPKP